MLSNAGVEEYDGVLYKYFSSRVMQQACKEEEGGREEGGRERRRECESESERKKNGRKAAKG